MLIEFLVLAILGSDRDWSGSELKTEVVKTVEVDRAVEVVRYASLATAVTWSEELLSMTEQPASSTEQEPLVMVMESHPSCRFCPGEWQRITGSSDFAERGWKSGVGCHFEKRDVVFDHTLPNWVLMRGDKKIAEFAAGASLESLTQAYSVEHGKTPVKSASFSALNAGTIKRQDVEMFLESIGAEGSFSKVRGKEQVVHANGIDVIIPAKFEESHNTDASGVFTANVKPSVVAKWGLIRVPVSGVRRSGDEIRIFSPLSMFDPVLKVVD